MKRKMYTPPYVVVNEILTVSMIANSPEFEIGGDKDEIDNMGSKKHRNDWDNIWSS